MTRPVMNVAASVRARLLNVSRATGEEFQRLLERYALERFLYRLSVSDHRELFILKGAMLLAAWPEMPARATRDLDFLGHGDSASDAVEERLRKVCGTEVPADGLIFVSDSFRVAPIREVEEYGGVRARFAAMLGTARIPLQVDVGFGDVVSPEAQEVAFPTILDHPQPLVQAYPVASVIAEKLEALVRLGSTNSRLKDFCDLWTLADTYEFDGESLSVAAAATFRRRQTVPETNLPDGLRPAYFEGAHDSGRWGAFVRRSGVEGLPEDFRQVGEELRTFLTPILEAVQGGAPLVGKWQKGAWRAP
jgi:predicted nucleotidyltransferase component of viral defense system